MRYTCIALILAIVLTLSACSCAPEPEQPPAATEVTATDTHENVPLTAAAQAIVHITGNYESYSADDFDAVVERYWELRVEGDQLGFTPVIVFPDDELVRNIYNNFDMLDYQQTGFENSPTGLITLGAETIKKRAAEADSTTLLIQMKSDRNANFDILGFESRSGTMGAVDDRLTAPDTECEVILLVCISTDTPWDALCWLPPGGWNECPAAFAFAAIARRWYDECGAVPALISSRCVQFCCPTRLSGDYALQLAVEQYCVAPQSEMFSCKSASAVAEHLQSAQVWRFDWVRTK